MLNQVAQQSKEAITEILKQSWFQKGDFLVIGCSSSKVTGHEIGSYSSEEIGWTIYNAIDPIVKEKQLFLAAQCCEHLNRALIIEQQAAQLHHLEIVNVVPQLKAGGSIACAAYHNMQHPVAVEQLQAVCGLDIGGTLIGMHLKPVAVPLALSVKKIGEAPLIAARTRPRFIGGERANYDPSLF